MNRLVTTRSDITTEHKHYTKCIIASYCLQSLIESANLHSAISSYKFYISKDQPENMKFTIICHLAAFLSVTIYTVQITHNLNGPWMSHACVF